MGYDPNEQRDKDGKWTGTGSASGHNAGKGNRSIVDKVRSDMINEIVRSNVAMALDQISNYKSKQAAIDSYEGNLIDSLKELPNLTKDEFDSAHKQFLKRLAK